MLFTSTHQVVTASAVHLNKNRISPRSWNLYCQLIKFATQNRSFWTSQSDDITSTSRSIKRLFNQITVGYSVSINNVSNIYFQFKFSFIAGNKSYERKYARTLDICLMFKHNGWIVTIVRLFMLVFFFSGEWSREQKRISK